MLWKEGERAQLGNEEKMEVRLLPCRPLRQCLGVSEMERQIERCGCALLCVCVCVCGHRRFIQVEVELSPLSNELLTRSCLLSASYCDYG